MENMVTSSPFLHMCSINAIKISPEVASSDVGCGPCAHNHMVD